MDTRSGNWIYEDVVSPEEDDITSVALNLDWVVMATELKRKNGHVDTGTMLHLCDDSCLRLTIDFPIFIQKYFKLSKS